MANGREKSGAAEGTPEAEGAAAAQDENDPSSSGPTACPTGTCDHKFWSCPGNAGFKVAHCIKLDTIIQHICFTSTNRSSHDKFLLRRQSPRKEFLRSMHLWLCCKVRGQFVQMCIQGVGTA